MFSLIHKRVILSCYILLSAAVVSAQNNFKLKYTNSSVYSGIEVGSKGIKMSILEVGKNAQSKGTFNILQESSINTDFITFSPATFDATLRGLVNYYNTSLKSYGIPSEQIFTVISSGVMMQAEKDERTKMVYTLIDSFKTRIRDSKRIVEVVDVLQEARLSHLGIVPEKRRYNTFLIDIGSGNSKGGYFPKGNTKDFKLFSLNWGTKSVFNAADKRIEGEKTLSSFNTQLFRVLSGAENSDIIYAVNESGSYAMCDNIAFSGGIAWSLAVLMYPELITNAVVPVSFQEVVKFSEKIYSAYSTLSDKELLAKITDNAVDTAAAGKEIRRVHQVFDQRALMAGTGLLLKVMRQFEGIHDKKQFYLTKNGQVGWVSAYVDQNIEK